MDINPTNARALRVEIEEALKAVADKHGLSIKPGKYSYGSDSITYQLEVAALGANGEVRDTDAENFVKFATALGLQPDDLNKPIMMHGKPFTVVGYRPSAKKNNICIKSPTGTVYVCPHTEVVRILHPEARKTA